MINRLHLVVSVLFLIMVLSGCGGVQTFPNTARQGETVSISMGWKKEFKRSNTTVTITPSSGNPIVYFPNDPAIRAIANLYPDPVSWLVVGTESSRYDNSYGASYGDAINNYFTNNDNDWWQTVAFIDLPAVLPLGSTSIQLTNSLGFSFTSIVEIVEGAGSSAIFNAELNGPLSSGQLVSLERSPHYEVLFNSDLIPYAIELKFSHDPFLFSYENGRAHVVNPRGNVKSILWSGDVTQLKVVLMPAGQLALKNINDFKFYIAGGISGLTLIDMQAFDENGNSVSGVNVNISAID